MVTVRRVGFIAGVLLLLAACGDSGGSGTTAAAPDGGSACSGASCGRDEEQPPAPLVCGGLAGAVCPQGYRCIDDPADDCDPVTSADCGGICLLGEELAPCGGFGGLGCPPGYACADDPNDGCEGGPAADCTGVCVPAAGECSTDSDCPPLRAPCSVCADGSMSCPGSICENGACAVVLKPCPDLPACGGIAGFVCPPGFECADVRDDDCDPASGADCGGICLPVQTPPSCGGFMGEVCPEGFECRDDPRDDCDPVNGGADCPGVCEPSMGGECRSDADCPQLEVACSLCPDGVLACPKSYCRAGRCEAAVDACRDAGFCGGIAGFPCPPGLTCIDDPADDCDPENGGADCGGICVREDKPRPCGGFAGAACPRGYDCADDPGDDCDPASGKADCPGFCQPAPNPMCASDADCPRIGAPCRLCPDGTAACPASSCQNGVCQVTFGGCSEKG